MIKSATDKILFYFQPGSFLRNLAVLGSGTALAQIIPILASPVLTRLYPPGDFGILAVFMALVGTFTPIICGKYEVALVLPKSRVWAEHLLGIAVYFALGVSGLLMAIFFFAGDSVLSLLHADRLGNWLFLVPLALLLTGVFNSFSYYANRHKQYRLMSKARITRSLVTAGTSMLAGALGAGFGGMLAGLLSGLSAAVLLLLYENRRYLSHRMVVWSRAKSHLLCRYRHYPVYSASTGFLDGLTLSLPVFFLSRYFPESVVGYYAIVTRVTFAPVSFISFSVSQVNLKTVVDLVNAGRPVRPYLFRLAALLLVIILLPAFVLMLWGPELFVFAFGEKWVQAGEFARILMPAVAVQFVSSTLSSTLGATNNNRLGAVWKVIAFVSTILLFFWLAPMGNINNLLYGLTILNLILYLLYFSIIIYAAGKPRNFL